MSDKTPFVRTVTYRIGSTEITAERCHAGEQPAADGLCKLIGEQIRSCSPDRSGQSGALRAEEPD